MNERSGNRRNWRMKVGVAAVAAIMAWGIAELLLSLLGVGFPRPYIPDQHIGSRLQPDLNAWFGKEGGAWVHANSSGFRDNERERQKPAGHFRIAVLGDSYVEAAQVALPQTFWKVLETKLNRTDGDTVPVEVMGFGISGFGTAQELLTWRHYIKPLKPDIVILAMTLSNDVRNNSVHLEPVRERPFFDLIDGVLIEDQSFRQSPAFLQAQERSTRLKTWLINCCRTLQLAAELKQRFGQDARQETAEPGLENSTFKPPATREWEAAWNITEALVLKLNDEVVADGATLVVVTLTTGIQVHPDSENYAAFCRQVGTEDLSYADKRIAAVCREHDVPVLTLAEPMREQALARHVWFHGFRNTEFGTGHWNQGGHHVAGELIAEFLSDSGILHR